MNNSWQVMIYDKLSDDCHDFPVLSNERHSDDRGQVPDVKTIHFRVYSSH